MLNHAKHRSFEEIFMMDTDREGLLNDQSHEKKTILVSIHF